MSVLTGNNPFAERKSFLLSEGKHKPNFTKWKEKHSKVKPEIEVGEDRSQMSHKTMSNYRDEITAHEGLLAHHEKLGDTKAVKTHSNYIHSLHGLINAHDNLMKGSAAEHHDFEGTENHEEADRTFQKHETHDFNLAVRAVKRARSNVDKHGGGDFHKRKADIHNSRVKEHVEAAEKLKKGIDGDAVEAHQRAAITNSKAAKIHMNNQEILHKASTSNYHGGSFDPESHLEGYDHDHESPSKYARDRSKIAKHESRNKSAKEVLAIKNRPGVDWPTYEKVRDEMFGNKTALRKDVEDRTNFSSTTGTKSPEKIQKRRTSFRDYSDIGSRNKYQKYK